MKKAAKTTRAAKRGKLPPRAEWDFSKVTRKDSAVVCMREYAKQCLREVAEKRARNYVLHLAEQYAGKLPGVTKKNLLPAVRDGLQRRSEASADSVPQHKALYALQPSDDFSELPPTAQIALFAVNWGKNNKEIMREFGDWLNNQSKRRHAGWEWMGGTGGAILEPLGLNYGKSNYDYVDAAEVLRDILQGALADDSADGAALIQAQRALTNRKKGRGDGKRALLTDLAVYRLHRWGCDGRQIAAALGASRLKFYDDALVTRAVKSAHGYVALTLAEAFFCEAHAVAIRS